MRYYKQVVDGIILSFGEGRGGEEISEEEYNAIRNAIASKPESTDTTDYMLTENLDWEAYEVQTADDEVDEAEAFDIIFGGAE